MRGVEPDINLLIILHYLTVLPHIFDIEKKITCNNKRVLR